MGSELKEFLNEVFKNNNYNPVLIQNRIPHPMINNSVLYPLKNRQYIPVLIDGIVVKHFPFILAHPKNTKLNIDSDKRLKTQKLKPDALATLKSEFENQLSLNQDYFDIEMSRIYASIKIYLDSKLNQLDGEKLTESVQTQFKVFIESNLVHTLNMISISATSMSPEMDFDFIRGNGWLRLNTETQKNSSFKAYNVEIRLSDILESQQSNFKILSPIIEKSILIYHDYLKVCAKLYDISLDSIVESFGGNTKTGRSHDFDPEKTEAWFNELKGQPNYLKKNLKPNFTKIAEEIENRHLSATGFMPADGTIRKQMQKIRNEQNRKKGISS